MRLKFSDLNLKQMQLGNAREMKNELRTHILLDMYSSSYKLLSYYQHYIK
jgi:hypothetical protein